MYPRVPGRLTIGLCDTQPLPRPGDHIGLDGHRVTAVGLRGHTSTTRHTQHARHLRKRLMRQQMPKLTTLTIKRIARHARRVRAAADTPSKKKPPCPSDTDGRFSQRQLNASQRSIDEIASSALKVI